MRERLLGFIVAALIVSDMLTGLLFNLQFGFYRVGVLLKSVILFLTFILYLPLIKRKTFFSIYAIIGMLVIFWSIGSAVSLVNNPQFELGNSLIVLSRYLLFLILVCAFLYLKDQPSFDHTCKKIIETFFLVNNSLIVLGFLFDINIFSSYNPQDNLNDMRFGYKGLIYGTNEVAGIYILGLSYCYRETFKYRERKGWLLFFTCLASLLTGTKATLIGLVVVTIFYFAKYKFAKLVVLMVPATVFLVIAVARNWESIKTKYLTFNIRVFESGDLLTFLMSGRNSYIISNFDYIAAKWTFLNYLVGDGFLYSETDLLDLFFFFGILGCMLYLYVLTKIFFIKDRTIDNHFVFLLLLSIAFTAGHIIQSAIVPVSLLLYIFSAKPALANHDITSNNRTDQLQ
jgi:hypothetical protein